MPEEVPGMRECPEVTGRIETMAKKMSDEQLEQRRQASAAGAAAPHDELCTCAKCYWTARRVALEGGGESTFPILTLAFVVGRLGADLVSALLGGMGFDRLPAQLGLDQAFAGGPTPSQLAGRVMVFFVMLFAVVEAANRLGFGQVSELVAVFIRFGADVLLGVAIIVVGFWLSNVAHDAIIRLQGEPFRTVAGVTRFAILGLIAAMGLRAMGLADDIVNLAFGLTLGGVAVAVALSFGLGGREAAGRQMEYWLSRWRGDRPR
jgi:hypothetical protein